MVEATRSHLLAEARVSLTREVVTAGDSSSSCTAETRVSILLSFTLYYGAYL